MSIENYVSFNKDWFNEVLENLIFSKDLNQNTLEKFKAVSSSLNNKDINMSVDKYDLIMLHDTTPCIQISLANSSSETFKLNCFINVDETNTIPQGRIVYDYYNSGEFYYNNNTSNSRIKIVSAKSRFAQYYKKVFFNSPNETTIETNISSYSINCVRFINDKYNGWILDISEFFNIDKDTSIPLSVHQYPVCANYTSFASGLKITAKNYPFANELSNSTVCSHFATETIPYTFKPCINNNVQNLCQHYIPSLELMASTTLTPQNSTSTIIISLKKYISTSNNIVYDIYNETISENILTLSYPNIPDQDIFALDSAANDTYQEILSSYSSFDLSETPNQNNSVLKQSYFATLIS